MAWKLTVAAVDKTTSIDQSAGVEIERVHNERATARFRTVHNYLPALRSEVVIYDTDGVTPLFGGIIFERRSVGFYQLLQLDCECADFSWYLQHTTVAGGTLTGTLTLKQVLEWFQTNYFASRGFTLDPAQVTGPAITVTGFSWERQTALEALRLVGKAFDGYVFHISPTKVWGMAKPNLATPTAPFAITDGGTSARELAWTETSEHYATKVILRWGEGTREISQLWTVNAAIIAAGYVETRARSIPTASASATVNGSPVTVGAPGSGAQLTWDWELHRLTAGTYVPVLNDVIVLTYTAQFPAESIADSGAVPAIELVFDAPEVTDDKTADPIAAGYLASVNQSPRTFVVDTLSAGLAPGQVLSINSTIRSCASMTALITKVGIRLQTDQFWRYRADAISGVYQGSELDAWRGLGGSSASGVAITPTYTGGINPGAGVALTRINDTNVTLALNGSPANALLAAVEIDVGWTGRLAAGRINLSAVHSIINDTNVTGSIASQNLTLGWTGLLSAARGGTGLGAFSVGDLLTFESPNFATIAAVASGRYLRSAGVTTKPVWSTLTLPNTATSTRVVYATSGNTWGDSANLTFNGTTLSTSALSVSGNATVGGTLGVTGIATFTDNAVFTANANPAINYTSNLGALSLKYLTLHAAELWVETLVAQNTIATIGGRILVGPTTTLTADLAPAGTTITVKHNQMSNGDRVYLEADGKVEWMAIASAASGVGPYTYTVTRNLDGTGANQWYAGDAMFNTGTTGKGFIDLYSLSGVLSGAGPTITGNVRTGTTYSQIAHRWAIGNLNNIYNYGVSDVYGAAFGDHTGTHLTIDATNGLRIRNGTTNKLVADTSGNLSLTGDLNLGTSGVFRSGATAYDSGPEGLWMEFNAGTPRFRFGDLAANYIAWNGTNLAVVGEITATSGTFTGGVTIGTGGSLASGATAFGTGTGFWLAYNGGTPQMRVGNPSGDRLSWNGTTLEAVSANLTINTSGIAIAPRTTGDLPDTTRAYAFTVATGALALTGLNYTGASGLRTIRMDASFTGVHSATTAPTPKLALKADYAPSSGGGSATHAQLLLNSTRNAPTGTAFAFLSASHPTTGASIDVSGTGFITMTGQVGIGILASYPLHVLGNVASTYAAHLDNQTVTPFGLFILYSQAAPNLAGNYFITCNDNAASRFLVYSNGGIANFSANNVNLSDARAKRIDGPAPSQRELFRRLPFVVGQYTDSPRTATDVMLTAQSVEAVFPELVEDFGDSGLKGVREHGLWMRACKVIQELSDEVDLLSARLAAVEGR